MCSQRHDQGRWIVSLTSGASGLMLEDVRRLIFGSVELPQEDSESSCEVLSGQTLL